MSAEVAAQARLRAAEAEAEAITRISQAMRDQGESAQFIITTRYIESLRDMARGNNSKVVFMPVETSAMLSSIGAIKEMLSETSEKRSQQDSQQQPPVRPRQLPNG